MRFLPIIIFGAICLLFALLIWQKPESKGLPSPLIGQSFPAIELSSLAIKDKVQLNKNVYGRVTIINIFASWCVPCLAEHPLWVDILKQPDVQLIGIAWRDKPERVNAWLNKHGNPYSQTFIDEAGNATVDIGITGVPETYILDKKGVIRMKFSAPLTESMIHNEVLPLLNQLQAE